MTPRTKAAGFSLLLHAALVLGAIAFIRPPGTICPPIRLDFSVLSASAGGLSDAASPGRPAATQPVKAQAVAAVKKKAAPKHARINKEPPPELAREPEVVPVATSGQPAAPPDDAAPSRGMATGSAAPAGPEPAGDWANGASNGAAGNGFYTTGQLDGPLTAMRKALPVYPHAAKSRHIEGWIRVQFVVDELGHVDQISVLAADPQGIFEQSVLRCVAGWRFKPGTIGATAVKTLVQQTIFFKLD
jgi:protein TonB